MGFQNQTDRRRASCPQNLHPISKRAESHSRDLPGYTDHQRNPLGEQLPGLMEAGLDAVNISLDT